MKYSITFNNYNDSRDVYSCETLKEAKKIALDTVRCRRFFQEGFTKKEKETGVVSIYKKGVDDPIYERFCNKK